MVGITKSTNDPRTDVANITTYACRMTDAPNCATAPTACAYSKGVSWKVTNVLNQTVEVLRYDGAKRVAPIKGASNVVASPEHSPHRRAAG